MSPRARRGERLTRDEVVDAAVRLIDRDGLDALTMRALGRELGADPMAAYHHVPDKRALLDAVVERFWSEVELPPPAAHWRDELAGIARAMRAVLLVHHRALPALVERPNTTPVGLDLAERAVGALVDAGLDLTGALPLVDALSSFVVGASLVEASLPGGDELDAYVAEAAATVDPGRHPHLSAAGGVATSPADTFERGLTAMLDGIERRLAGR